MVLKLRRRRWLHECTRTQQASQHTYSNVCFYAYCFVLVVALFYTSPLQAGDLTPRLGSISQYAWGATCPWSRDSSHDECMGCGNLAGPPPASTELCAVRCDVTWVQFDEGKSHTDIEVQLVTAGAVHSEEQLDQVTVLVHESFGAPDKGSISQITLTREGTPQLVWAGEDATGCGGVLTANGFKAVKGSYPKVFDGLSLRVRRVTTAGQPSHPALAAVHITSPPATDFPSCTVTALYLLAILLSAAIVGLQCIVHHAASITNPQQFWMLGTTTDDLTKVLGMIAAGGGVMTIIVPSTVSWSEAPEYMQVHYHLWLGILSGCCLAGLAGVYLARMAVQGTRDAKAAGYRVKLASQLCTFDVGAYRAASMCQLRGVSLSCVAVMAVWRVMRHRLSLGMHLHIALALCWLCWLWLSRRDMLYAALYFRHHRKLAIAQVGDADDGCEGGGRRKLFRPTSLNRRQLRLLQRFQVKLRMKMRSRRGGGMVASLRAAVRYMSVQQLEEEVKRCETSHEGGHAPLTNIQLASSSPGSDDSDIMPRSWPTSTADAIQALMPLLGREQRMSPPISTSLTRGCGVMIPLDTKESQAAAPSCLPSPLPTTWRSTTCNVHGVSPAPLIPLRHAKVPLVRSSVEWASIARYLCATSSEGGTEVEVASIERVQNPMLWQRYRSRVKELRADLANARRCLAHGECGSIAEPQLAAMVEGHRELLLWHGTSARAVDSICEVGFRPQVTTRAALGPGCYFGLRSETAMKYAEDKHARPPPESRSGRRSKRRLKLVLSVVAAGVEVKGDRGRRDRDNRGYDNYAKGLLVDVAVDSCRDSIPYGSDVTMQCPSMMCVMDGRQVYPAFVVTVMV